MKQNSYELVDDLFGQIRLRLLRVRESDPATTEELKSLLTQLEDCVESLVIDSIKLKSLESTPKKTTESGKRTTKIPSKKEKSAE